MSADIQSGKKRKGTLGWDLGIISSPSRHQFIASMASNVQITSLKQKLRGRTLNNSANDFFKCVSPAFSPAQLTSTDPKQHTTKNTRNLLQIKFVLTENKESSYQTWPSRLFGCIFPTNSAFSRPIGASRPQAQHMREFDIFCEILAHQ